MALVNWNDFDAALFDLDGVLTPTAEVHMRAWQALFTDFLTKRGLVDQPYVESDYFDYIDGKPRYDGVRSFLASRGITLAEGEPVRRPGDRDGLRPGQPEERLLRRRAARRGGAAVPGLGRSCSTTWPTAGTQVAVVSSSRNAPPVLEAVGSGGAGSRWWSTAMSPPGSTCPASRRRTPSRTRPPSSACRSERAVVFEDALSGVEAGRAGRFGLVVGVDRGVGAERLTESGADVVVTDLAELAE